MMYRTLNGLSALACVAAIASPTGMADGARFWFSTQGASEYEPIEDTPSEYITGYQGTIPTLESTGDPLRLYLWGSLLYVNTIQYNGLNFHVSLYPVTGQVAFEASDFYNGTTTDGRSRWDGIDDGVVEPLRISDTVGVASVARGFTSLPPPDLQYDPQTKSLLLGVITIEAEIGAQADIFLAVGSHGIGSIPNNLPIYFGWVDGPVNPWEEGRESTLADARIIPEPATLALFVAVAGLLRVRRRR